MSKTWFITGASRGFGRVWATAALERGDRVAATARDTATLDDLVARFGDAVLPLQLDVQDRDGAFGAVRRAHEHFGSLDVVVNNAGYGHFGYVEELTEAEVRAQMETNFFGLLWVTQAAIPLMRAQGSGHLVQVSSVVGTVGGPSMGAYAASKFAVEGLSESLAAEVAPFGIKVTIVEPGGYATDWGTTSATRSEPLAAYQAARDQAAAMGGSMPSFPAPDATASALLAIVDGAEAPLRVPLSSLAYDGIVQAAEARIDGWRQQEAIARSADRA